ncbi:MAG TPA: DUF3426 domain-containing protein, partial [Ramlibacter sp.]|nr:DUF3426 domain-containing protein [Ramlibacter sp.]
SPAGPAPVAPPPRSSAPPAGAGAARNSEFGVDSQSLEPSPLDSPFVFRRSDLLLRPEGDSHALPPLSGYPSQLPEDEADEPTPAELRNVSFVRQARRRAFWHRPTVRVLMVLFSLGLAGLLVLQLAYHDRDRLALAQPRLHPALERMCELMRCQLGAPRQIEAIVIENSGFNRLRNDNYRVAVTLRNTAPVAVAAPAMELTITDGQDQPLARRVLTPAELGIPGSQLPAASDWSGSIGLALAPVGGARVAGYRLLAFYP